MASVALAPVTEEVVDEMVRRIVAPADPERIILFGRCACSRKKRDRPVREGTVLYTRAS